MCEQSRALGHQPCRGPADAASERSGWERPEVQERTLGGSSSAWSLGSHPGILVRG